MSIQFDRQRLMQEIEVPKPKSKVKEMSAVGGGVTTGATATSGVGEQVPTTKAFKKKGVKEDAPMLAHGKADISTSTKDGFTHAERGHSKIKGIIVKDLWEDDYTDTDAEATEKDDTETLAEARGYNQFKKEASTRNKTQQMHEATKMISKKLDEINKLLEYTNQMRSELSESDELMEYKSNTRKLFEKITGKVVETYSKVKKLK